MTTDEFIQAAKDANGEWVTARYRNSFLGFSHSLRWHDGRLYHEAGIDGIRQRSSIRGFKRAYGERNWELEAA